jgi:hypothetical protein
MSSMMAINNRTRGYYGAGMHGYNSVALEEMCPGLGEFAETIANSFRILESKAIKCMVYTPSPHIFPLHNDEAQTENLFRVSISLSDSMPDPAMRYQRNMRTFEMERGFLAVVIMDMCGAGRIAGLEKPEEGG